MTFNQNLQHSCNITAGMNNFKMQVSRNNEDKLKYGS